MITQRTWLAALFSFLLLSTVFVGRINAQSKMFYPGEEIEYKVTYMGINLGSVIVYTVQHENLDGKKVAYCKAKIRSNPGIPFVSIHTIYNSWMDTNFVFSHQFLGSQESEGNQWGYDKYMFKYAEKKLVLQKQEPYKPLEETIINSSKKWSDGLSIFFFAREYLHSKRNILAPTVIERDTVNTSIYFAGNVESTEIDAVNYPIRTKYLRGVANWTGVYGLSGKFEGWFSDDEASIPIRAKMKVYVGNVNIELVKWKRGSWQPPKA